ncbi:MAG: porphobilinogen synthase [Candidatus Omnitrophica bacterium]|nr:porphobilinogen synthase [Candidatus Omnitrophota bacterium]MCM8802605.1 porphobilinogen synthase [Candidatus Omnitrophota bacterium]
MEIIKRLRRLRKTETLRKIFSETKLSISDLIMPYFVVEGKNIKEPIKSMPGIFRYSIDNLLNEIEDIYNLGIFAILLFGVPEKKDDSGKNAYDKNGIVQKAVKIIKKEIQDIIIITDVCLCSYTNHGHCGILSSTSNFQSSVSPVIDNDATLEILSEIALSHAESGADIVAPSSMMDGQVKIIRETLDKNGFFDVIIMSYSAKYASNFYGPFREAANSFPKFGDRKSYQINYHNLKEALREVEQDINEGADIVMVKPALAYLDVIMMVKEKFNIPVVAYNVSGEYSMIKAASEKEYLDEKNVVLEILTSIKRAGADLIITYWAKEIAKWLKE